MEAVQECIRWGWRRNCVVERRGKEVHQEAERRYTKKQKPRMVDGSGGEGGGGREAGSMKDDNMH